MADITVNEKEVFEFTYSAKQQEEIEKIKNKYLPKQESKMEQLRKLDKSAEKPGTITAIALGTIGSLIMGAGMSLVMSDFSKILGAHEEMALLFGVGIGIVGIVFVCLAYPFYLYVVRREREKVAPEIIRLTDELMK